MAGLELVVRPVVFPNIRPATPGVLVPQDDPTQGFCTLNGSGGGLIALPHSFSVSFSSTAPKHEQKRQFDTERVYQKDRSGNINRKNFIEIERLKKLLAKSQDSTDDTPIKVIFADPPPRDNVETIESDVTRIKDAP